jgi:hypothetical protein
MKILSVLILSAVSTALFGCGIKGKPLPPLNPPVLGRGEPHFSKATEGVKIKKKPPAFDWQEPEDFPEEREK